MFEKSRSKLYFCQPMEFYQLESTNKSPKIVLDKNKGELIISGRSVVNERIDIYNELLEELDKYCENPVESTTAIFHLEYFGDRSSRIFLEIFRKLESIHRKKCTVLVQWFYSYEDLEMRDTGQDYEHLFNIPFELVPVKDEDL